MFRRLDALLGLAGYLIAARRLSEGMIRSVIVSELNQRGEIKGLSLEYRGDLALRLQRTKTPGYVDIDCSKAREAGFGEIGTFLLDWKNGTFLGEA